MAKAKPKSTSRRALVAGLVALPSLATAATAGGTPDPIFAALERHRRVVAALHALDECAEPERYDAAGDDLVAADRMVIGTRPTTIAGCLALIDFVVVDIAEHCGVDDYTYRAFKTLAEALPRLTA